MGELMHNIFVRNKLYLLVIFLFFSACKSCGSANQLVLNVHMEKISSAKNKNDALLKLKKEQKIIQNLSKYQNFRDPFTSYFSRQRLAGKINEELPYAESLKISSLKLVGVLTSKGENTALFQDTFGKGHIFKKGSMIGKEGSYIHSIEDKAVVIKKFTYKNKNGKQYKRVRVPLSK